jgi:hypothetical protein
MVVALIIVTGVVIFAIAAGVVGREARRLDAVAPRAVYDVEEAVDFIAGRLPEFAAGQLTHDELRQLLTWHLGQLRANGLTPPKAVDHVQDIGDPVVIEEDGAVGYLIGRAELAGWSVPDEAIVFVVEQHFAYFEAIGAVGPPADDPAVALPPAPEPPPALGS